MVKILEKNGFRLFGKPWKRNIHDHFLGLFLIEGVDLYGGVTKHSTVTALGEQFSPDEIKKYATQHTTNKAFDRYFHVNPGKSKSLYAVANKSEKTDTGLTPEIRILKK